MSAENPDSQGAPRRPSAPHVSSNESSPPGPPSDSPATEADPQDPAQEISDIFSSSDARRKPLRSVAPRDSVQPRGIQGISRVPPAAMMSRRTPADARPQGDFPRETPAQGPSETPSAEYSQNTSPASGPATTDSFSQRENTENQPGTTSGFRHREGNVRNARKSPADRPAEHSDRGDRSGYPRTRPYPNRGPAASSSRWPSSFKTAYSENASDPQQDSQAASGPEFSEGADFGPPRQRREGQDARGQRERENYRPGTRRYESGGYSRGRFGAKDEPLSLAEELADEMSAGRGERPEVDEVLRMAASLGDHTLAALQKLSVQELISEARKYHLADSETMENLENAEEEAARRQDLVFRILREKVKLNGLLYGEGTLEILPDGFGFLRSMATNYISCPDDIYVSPSQIRRFGLQNGNVISGQIRPPKENERYFALLRVEAINFRDPNENLRKKRFDELTPTHPTQRLTLESAPEEVETRVTDMMIPIGFGQRGLIVSPPRAGKTILLQKIAKSALKNFPDIYIFMLLIDERPEEVTDMERALKCANCEVISSTFDETPGRHIQISQMVMEKAKRMVECGQNVVILLDSITRLARAYNAECETSGKTLTGGVDANALQEPKRFFGNARCVEEGGSLTIIATALIETGSQMDDVIFEEFKGTGNLEIVLDKKLVELRVWPSIDLNASGTRRDEMLMPPEEFAQVCKLRRLLSELNPIDAMEMLTNRLRKTKTNAEFLAGIS